jgi:hypothetical protein
MPPCDSLESGYLIPFFADAFTGVGLSNGVPS